MGSPRVMVAVDFGTTFSGFAYLYVNLPTSSMQEIQGVHKLYEWNGAMEANAVPYCKTQTSLYYEKDPKTGALELKNWGWPAYVSFMKASKSRSRANLQSNRIRSSLPLDNGSDQLVTLADIAADADANGSEGYFITAFKLHLAGVTNEKKSVGRLAAETLPTGLTLERAITDYLTGLSGCIMKQLQKTYGPQLTCKEVKWCLTVPAIWDNMAKQKMKVFAEMAGMVQGRYTPRGVQASPHELLICLEPEAASLYCLQMSDDIHLQKGDRYLVADVGGGHVDIMVHEMASADKVTLTVKEVVASYGCLSGGNFMDMNFFELVKKKIPVFEA